MPKKTEGGLTVYQYSNSFSYAYNHETGEYLLSFRQQYPVLDDKNGVTEMTVESVCDITLNRAGIIALKDLLDKFPLE